MTREEAIEVIKAYRDKLTNSASNQLDGDIEAFEMAIQALEQNESAEEWYKLFVEKLDEQKPCDDVVSRKDAEQMFRNIRSHLKPQDYKSAEEFNTRDLMLLNAEQMIHALPSVTHKSGKWIVDKGSLDSQYGEVCKCSKCEIESIGVSNFCPNCGARMESEDEG